MVLLSNFTIDDHLNLYSEAEKFFIKTSFNYRMRKINVNTHLYLKISFIIIYRYIILLLIMTTSTSNSNRIWSGRRITILSKQCSKIIFIIGTLIQIMLHTCLHASKKCCIIIFNMFTISYYKNIKKNKINFFII